MAFARKGYVYRQYIRNTDGGVNVPDSTWRRWLQKGKITKEQLLEMGITPAKRRRVPKSQVEPMNPGGQAEASRTGTFGVPNHVAVDEIATLEDLSADCEANSVAPSRFELECRTFHAESLSSGSECSTDTDSVSLSSFTNEETSDSDDNNDQWDEINEGNQMLLSVLESSNIDVDKLNEPLVPSLQISKFETLLMILHLALRHGFTDVFLEDMMAFVNELVGVEDAIPKSKFLFNKLFLFASHPTIHFFCPKCNIYLGLSSAFLAKVVCSRCKMSNSSSSLNDGNYFLTMSISNQIKDVLNRPHIKLLNREQRFYGNISDTVDGLLYQSLMKDGESLTNPNALSISFNCDGSPIFKSGPNSLWPIQFVINEIEPKQRFEAENTLVAGLWFSKSKPSMEVFLQPFVDELRDLEKNGVVWKKSDGSVCESPVYAISCCVDSVAKPQIQKLMQFNGKYGCGYCLHPNSSITVFGEVDRRSGIYVVDGGIEGEETIVQHNRKMLRYIVGDYPLRTDRQLRQHMKQALTTGKVTFGAKGESPLCALRYFNVVHGFPVDYMHAILLGVMRRLANLWFDSSSSGKEFYIGKEIKNVDERLIRISPPSHMRYVRPISDRVHWKANEWRGFLLYFGLPALLNYLPRLYYNHFKKLVTAVYILSRDSMTYDDIEDAHKLLQDFVKEFQSLYGEVNMVYNVHLCSHLARSVYKLGPLWANSAFPFESGNGRLVKLAKGTQGVATQIARKYLMSFSVPRLISCDYKARDSVINFCSNIVGYKYLKNATVCNNVNLLGTESYHELTPEQREAFSNCGIRAIPKFVAVFNRAVKGGTIYCGRLTSKQVKHDDSCVRLTSAAFARIELIFKLTLEEVEKAWCICKVINIAVDSPSSMSPHIKQCSLEPFGSLLLLPFDDIEKKCILVSCNDKKYVAEFPNTFEKD